MGYVRDRYKLKNGIEVCEHHTGSNRPSWMPRRKKRKPTPEEMEKANQREKTRKVRRLMLNNFGEGDLYVTLTYRKEMRPPGMEEAKADFRRFMGMVKRRFKKAGADPKWIRNIEQGSRGGWHAHVLLGNEPGLDVEGIVTEVWEKRMGKGRVISERTYLEGGFNRLAAYMAKEARQPDGTLRTSFSTSRNLERPERERSEYVRRNAIRENGIWKDPVIPEGYYLDKESVETWDNPLTGYPCRRYMCLRLPGQDERRIYEKKHRCHDAADRAAAPAPGQSEKGSRRPDRAGGKHKDKRHPAESDSDPGR